MKKTRLASLFLTAASTGGGGSRAPKPEVAEAEPDANTPSSAARPKDWRDQWPSQAQLQNMCVYDLDLAAAIPLARRGHVFQFVGYKNILKRRLGTMPLVSMKPICLWKHNKGEPQLLGCARVYRSKT